MKVIKGTGMIKNTKNVHFLSEYNLQRTKETRKHHNQR